MNIQRRRLLERQFNKFKRNGKTVASVNPKIQAQYAEWLRNDGGGEHLMLEQKPDVKNNLKVEKKTKAPKNKAPKKKTPPKKGLFG